MNVKTAAIAAMLTLFAAPAFAEEPAAPVEASAEAPAAEAPAPVEARRGQMVVTAGGIRLGSVSRVNSDGSPRVIFEGRVITVPVSSLTLEDGRLVSSLTRAEIAALN